MNYGEYIIWIEIELTENRIKFHEHGILSKCLINTNRLDDGEGVEETFEVQFDKTEEIIYRICFWQ